MAQQLTSDTASKQARNGVAERAKAVFLQKRPSNVASNSTAYQIRIIFTAVLINPPCNFRKSVAGTNRFVGA